MNFLKLTCVCASTLFLLACGGGGGGVSSSTATSVGVFLDSPVAGINYKTESQSGQTDSQGRFNFIQGETVTFSVGEITLPPAPANTTVTTLDLAGTTDPNHPVAVNVAVFLQSINQYSDPTNGIVISQAAHTAATKKIDFTVPSTTFNSNTDLIDLVNKSGGQNRTLVSESDAKAHVTRTLNGENGNTVKINIAPIAKINADQSGSVGTKLIFSGNDSRDANNDQLTYSWSITSAPTGSSATLTGQSLVNASLTPDKSGDYVIRLVVNDGVTDSSPETITVSVISKNAPPVANPGSNASTVVGTAVVLDGTRSSDPDGDSITYSWVLVSGPDGFSASVSNQTTSIANFTPDKPGAYVVGLTVSDGKVNSKLSVITITVTSNSNSPALSIENGSLNSPFTEAALIAAGITNPNGYVKSTATGRIFDMRWGSLDTPIKLSDSDNVKIDVKSKGNMLLTVSPLLSQSVSVSVASPYAQKVVTGTSSKLMQEAWISDAVHTAWSAGVTGMGVNITILDDFTVNDASDIKGATFSLPCMTIPAGSSNYYWCPSNDGIMYTMTHGQQVNYILSGNYNSLSAFVYFSGLYSNSIFPLLPLGSISAYQPFVVGFPTPLYGIAHGASKTTNRDDYLTHQKNTNGLFDQIQKWSGGTDQVSKNFQASKVVNLSLGGTSANPVKNKQTYAAQLAYANQTAVPEATFVKAAGNASCIVSNTNCDPLNAVFYSNADFKKKTVIVGALKEPGGVIASYSNLPGKYSDRFIVADGRGIKKSNGTFENGTSFAAPRVSAAAALIVQKYPNLSAADVSDILLSTAKWNSAWGQKTATLQEKYGQGELDLSRALAPIGYLP